jgi:hypothetical protein
MPKKTATKTTKKQPAKKKTAKKAAAKQPATGKHPGGRPTKYSKKYCKQIIDFFDIEPCREVEIPHYKKGDLVWTDFKMVPNRIPTLRKFAKHIKVNFTTVYEWEKKYPEFTNALTHARQIRKEFLIDNGLAGLYPPNSFKFVAINMTDMTDKQEFEHSGEIILKPPVIE